MTHEAVGAFIYAGGFSLGMRKHFNVLAHLEDGSFGVETSRANMPELEFHTEPANWPVRRYAGVPVVYSNPPCAPWSSAGSRHKTVRLFGDDPRARDTVRSLELVDTIRPKVWVWESVPQAYHRGGEFMDRVTGHLAELGYSVTHVLLDAKFTGLPQRRSRVLTVGHTIEIPWHRPTHGPVTVRQAIQDITPDYAPPVTPKWAPGIAAAPYGAVRRWVNETNADGKQVGPGFLLMKVDPDCISPVVTGNFRLIHWDTVRYLSPAECAVLNGYPPDYIWMHGKSPSRKIQQVGKMTGCQVTGRNFP